jgi:hypothetical protein
MKRGSLRLSRKIVSSRYLLLHSHGESIDFIKLADEGPRVLGRSDLLNMGYPPSRDEDKKKDDLYIVYSLDPNRTEREWSQYRWHMSEVSDNRGNQVAIPEPIRLSTLIKKAKR